jgi:hypothetical protein
MNPSEAKQEKPLRISRKFFDFETFDDVVLGKDVPFKAVASLEEALAAAGNDQAKLLEIVNDGLKSAVRKAHANDLSGWHTYKDVSKGLLSDLNGAYEGTPADASNVRETVNTLACTIFGYDPSMTSEEKEKRKAQAMEMVKNTPSIREGLARS